MIRNYLLITLRNLTKNKVFIFINVFGIGIAVACCIVAYLNYRFDKDWDKDQVNAGSIYRIQFWQQFEKKERNRYGMAPNAMVDLIKQNFTDVDKVVSYEALGTDFRVGDELFNTQVGHADSAFFEMFTFQLKQGSFKDFGDKSKIFISDELARKYFKREDVVGQPLTQMDNGKPREYIVGGVFKKQPKNSSFICEAYASMNNFWDVNGDPKDETRESWSRFKTIFLQINDAGAVPSITKRLQVYVEPQNKAREDFKIQEFYLENFKGIVSKDRGQPELRGNWLRQGLPEEALYVPNIMAILLLLLACFNFTNTSIAVSSQRLKEIGIRKVMGGVRSQLVLQFLGENLLLCFFGLLVGLLMAEFLVPAYDHLWNWLELDYKFAGNSGFFVFLAGLLIATALLAGSYPAFYITSFEPIAVLKGKMKFGGTNNFTRVLLCFQFMISILAIIFAVAFYSNAQYQKKYDLGYATSGIIAVYVNDEGGFNTYRDALSSNTDIKVIAGTKHHIGQSWYNDPVKYESLSKEVDIMDVGDRYLDAMSMKLLKGRQFKKDSRTDMLESVLVSEEFVKQFGWTDDPIGKRVVWMDTSQLFVVGVVKDIYARALWAPIQPMMFRYAMGPQYRRLVVSAPAEKMSSVNEFMEKKWKEVFPNSMYNGQFIDRQMAETLEVNSNIVKLFGFLGFFAILLSVTGLYTLVSLNILKKMKEIGVRKVMGASIANIARVINLEFVVILSIAGILGGAAGYFATEIIMKSIWVYYLKLDLVSFSVSIAIMFAIAAVAVSFKTFSTAKMNPVKTLRDE
jgi:putative ABC transport system permease protein